MSTTNKIAINNTDRVGDDNDYTAGGVCSSTSN